MSVVVAGSNQPFPQPLANRVVEYLRQNLAGIDVLDGGVLATPTRPYVTFHAGVGVRTQQRYSARKARFRWTFSVMVVNNSEEGVRFLAQKVVSLLDEWREGPEVYVTQDYTADPICDDEVEGDWRWSLTCYFKANPPRRDS